MTFFPEGNILKRLQGRKLERTEKQTVIIRSFYSSKLYYIPPLCNASSQEQS